MGARSPRVLIILATLALTAALTLGAAPLSLERRIAPPFSLRGVTGETLRLDRLLAKGPVVLDFWATWCHPCVEEIPELDALYRRYAARGLTVVGVSADGPRNYAKVRPAASRLGMTYPIAIDEDGRMQQLYQVRALPTTVLIDTSGVVIRVREGWHPGETRDLEAAIAKLLPAPEAPAR